MSKQTPKEAAFTERQMGAWNLAQEIAERLQPAAVDPPRRKLGEYITVSREVGAGGGEIAQIVGQKLGWEVLDKNLLDQIAARYHISRPTLEVVDETRANWAHDILGVWLDPKIIPHEKYVVYLGRIITAAARRGRVVIVGRGASFLLPRDRGLAVRVIASAKSRLDYVMRHHGFNEAQARRYLDDLERGRREFVERFFLHDMTDPHLFDLVINVDRLQPEGAADEIIAAYRRRNPLEVPASSPQYQAAYR